uniref:Uncharacterized protein n=1 Tax=Ditylenchus dipsaci TaxID=166011 RepID=A0A915CZQ2_9BILA
MLCDDQEEKSWRWSVCSMGYVNWHTLRWFLYFAFSRLSRISSSSIYWGALWSIGNALIIPVIHELGMGPAFLLPDTLNCILNFSIGYWGLFLTIPRPPHTPWLAFVGLLFILLGGAAISQVKNKKQLIPAIAHPSAVAIMEDESIEAPALPQKKLSDSKQAFSFMRKMLQNFEDLYLWHWQYLLAFSMPCVVRW